MGQFIHLLANDLTMYSTSYTRIMKVISPWSLTRVV